MFSIAKKLEDVIVIYLIIGMLLIFVWHFDWWSSILVKYGLWKYVAETIAIGEDEQAHQNEDGVGWSVGVIRRLPSEISLVPFGLK